MRLNTRDLLDTIETTEIMQYLAEKFKTRKDIDTFMSDLFKFWQLAQQESYSSLISKLKEQIKPKGEEP